MNIDKILKEKEIYESEKEQISLKDLHEWTATQTDGYVCPCCQTKVKIYERTVDSALIAFMIAIVKLYRQTGKYEHHHATVTKFCSERYKIAPTHYALLSKFYLIENNNGMVSLSNKGILFLKGLIPVAKKIYVANNQVISTSDEKLFINEIEAKLDKYHQSNRKDDIF